jgi:hypothetical protein
VPSKATRPTRGIAAVDGRAFGRRSANRATRRRIVGSDRQPRRAWGHVTDAPWVARGRRPPVRWRGRESDRAAAPPRCTARVRLAREVGCSRAMTGTEQSISSLVNSLAWPGVAVGIGLLFRPQLSDLLSTSLRKLKVGPFEAEFDRVLASVEAELHRSCNQVSRPRVCGVRARRRSPSH